MRIQPHPDRGPPTAAVFLIPPAQLPSVCVSLAFQPLRLSGRLCKPPLIPRWRRAARIPGMGHIVERCAGVASSYARWTSALAGAPFSRENAGFGDRSFTLNYAPISKPHAGLAPAPLRDSGAHPPTDRRRWLCDIVSGLQGHDAYAERAAGCVAGGIKHGHAHTGYMIAAGCCAGPAAAKEETWKAVCLTIPWYQFTPSKVTWRDILKPLSLFGAAVLRGAPKYRVGWRS